MGMREQLFRKEASRPQVQNTYGSIVLTNGPGQVLIISALLFLVLTLLVSSFYLKVSTTENVEGIVVAEKGYVKPAISKAGVIEAVHIKLGQTVSSDDQLITIDLNSDKLASASVKDLLSRELERLVSQRDRIPESFKLIQDDLDNKLSAKFVSIKGLEERISIQKRILNLESSKFEIYKNLNADNTTSSLEVSNQETIYLQQKKVHSELVFQLNDLRSDVKQIEAQINQSKIDKKNSENVIESDISKITMKLVEKRATESILIRSPIDGIVSAVTVKKGQSVKGGDAPISILPLNASVEVELLLPSRASAFIEKGQKVKLKLDAFPYQIYGAKLGEVISISRTPVESKKYSEPVFLAKVSLPEKYFLRNGDEHLIQPGMQVEANIILENERLVDWVIGSLGITRIDK